MQRCFETESDQRQFRWPSEDHRCLRLLKGVALARWSGMCVFASGRCFCERCCRVRLSSVACIRSCLLFSICCVSWSFVFRVRLALRPLRTRVWHILCSVFYATGFDGPVEFGRGADDVCDAVAHHARFCDGCAGVCLAGSVARFCFCVSSVLVSCVFDLSLLAPWFGFDLVLDERRVWVFAPVCFWVSVWLWVAFCAPFVLFCPLFCLVGNTSVLFWLVRDIHRLCQPVFAGV